MVAIINTTPVAGENEQKSSVDHLSTVLETLTACLNSASTSLPSPVQTEETSLSPTILPPADGISLLDTKAELLLSYLQNLVFLVLFQLRGRGKNDAQGGVSQEDIVKKLTELKVYLDRGVKSLEGRLKYQIDKVVKAAEDAERAAKTSSKKSEDNDGDEDSSEYYEDASNSDEDEEASESEDEDIDEMAYRPNITAFSKDVQKPNKEVKTTTSKDRKDQPSDGIYRPPRIKPTALPTTESRDRDRERRPKKSSVIDEFVSAEMSSAPIAEPSIGSTIQRGGRQVMSQQDRAREAERRTYEETNFVRLPKESKKERAKRRAAEGPRSGGFGGEDFRSLGEGADRIARLTKRSAGSRAGALEKSRKRAFTEDGPRGDGAAVGQSFEKRRKKVEGWKK
ncbi:U3 small nucleolar ribonucleoprotein protein Lcp5, putative [Talaromyces stipitatus ATCC 10500]|uniref:U3 small nucleolar ribonucleoprotein protein Lcp5, putative n=1 Tax=Talaromyces stipitatus (strain ATCC 10500 / CBS 375.48 / QM 6759 / NRRL 1006) TaxID=441959 RepID=B8MU48_TALSN|nr:U3 small nucleolar ribonucleoprotein Lcp5, putative [Talaromyces stipitatus ATCC 10500]EED12681.1 U3 small nucleolar ribonucleoprotein protein Lcp5, putative [Talaromyces stipitatus ATCC 10500]